MTEMRIAFTSTVKRNASIDVLINPRDIIDIILQKAITVQFTECSITK